MAYRFIVMPGAYGKNNKVFDNLDDAIKAARKFGSGSQIFEGQIRSERQVAVVEIDAFDRKWTDLTFFGALIEAKTKKVAA